ncbi:phosphoglycolate phosphatase [Altererythrobacter atlanticus]|uniref:phosphoglycolate phosphatase n=1 Tax=Croceibacterium atlanticum TaxID=1267766 RepID=A0A0F7KNS2_9SPHN|nr:HAD-IA family hydrolase [Croceibacterium atlanticum]AKH42158.1 Phosphoglycolate phosphatase [Croceibacterium atlanticum]MBB5734029.1 phosphoglycolate phosphatase [Croceibacterium atlanticum]
MTQFPFSIVGFDLDGTLVDSNRDLAPAINHALSKAGRDVVPDEQVRHLIGGGALRMLERAVEQSGVPASDTELHAMHDDLMDHYEAHIADNTVPYDGCLAALDQLAEHGCKLAVVTNKVERNAIKLLDALGMSDRFTCILGGDTLGPGRAKPAPDMIQAAIRQCGGSGRFAMVGDSSFDTRAARAAAVPVVAVSFGYNDIPVPELDCDVMIDHFDELVPALARLRA